MSLTAKQLVFVREYQIDLNGTQAAIRAGYSPKTANEQAAQLLAKLSVREAIDAAQTARAERLNIDADWVVRNFRNLYLEALAAGEFGAAARCLESLGKYVGVFAKHQNQKRQYTRDDLDRLKTELEAAGMDFSVTNLPPGPSPN